MAHTVILVQWDLLDNPQSIWYDFGIIWYVLVLWYISVLRYTVSAVFEQKPSTLQLA